MADTSGRHHLKQQQNDEGAIPFISSLTIKHLYELLNVRQSLNVEFQAFFALLQQASEEKQIMDLNDNRQDDYVPIDVVQEFTRNFIRGFGRLMKDIGYAKNWKRC
jgi:hypothetical protein